MSFQLDAHKKDGRFDDSFDVTGWTWKPIALLCAQLDTMLGLGLKISKRNWFYNDGRGLENQEACSILVGALKTFLKTMKPGLVLVWTQQETAELRKTKVLAVKHRLHRLNGGTAVLIERRLACDPKNGYFTERSDIVDFVAFLKRCGGFDFS